MSLSYAKIEKYKKRICFEKDLEPTLEVLQDLQKAHLLHIPFENLDIHYNTPIELDIGRIYDKVVNNKRGGFCYELNGLFFQLLKYIGFEAKQVSVRVFSKETGYSNEFDHLAIVVTIKGRDYLTDVGFGEFAFRPLFLDTSTVQNDERGQFIVDNYKEEYIRISKILEGKPLPEYIFKNKHHYLREFSNMCNYHQTSPDSHFTKKKLISRPTEQGRITLTSDQLKIVENGITSEFEITHADNFQSKLIEYFHLRV